MLTPYAMKKTWLLALLVVVGCGEPELEASVNTAEVNGIEGMFEYATDLPWRLEPRTVNRETVYDPIPITLAIF